MSLGKIKAFAKKSNGELNCGYNIFKIEYCGAEDSSYIIDVFKLPLYMLYCPHGCTIKSIKVLCGDKFKKVTKKFLVELYNSELDILSVVKSIKF